MKQREIKFRAWQVDYLEMHSWNEIDYINSDEVGFSDGDLILPHSKVILMQYTGLKDKNGKELYFEDIILVQGNQQMVVENNSYYSFLAYLERTDFEVIGNIYENPELLK